MSQGESGRHPNSLSMVAVGSNATSIYGGTKATVQAAIRALENANVALAATSRLYQTPCFPAGNGPDFVNAVVLVATKLTPRQLLSHLHKIESNFGRIRTERWGARTLDLDLIAVGDRILPDSETVQGWIDLSAEQQMKHAPKHLILPHPRLQDRGFVLIPLADVIPDWHHPILGKSVKEMINALPEAEKTAIHVLE